MASGTVLESPSSVTLHSSAAQHNFFSTPKIKEKINSPKLIANLNSFYQLQNQKAFHTIQTHTHGPLSLSNVRKTLCHFRALHHPRHRARMAQHMPVNECAMSHTSTVQDNPHGLHGWNVTTGTHSSRSRTMAQDQRMKNSQRNICSYVVLCVSCHLVQTQHQAASHVL